MPFTYSLSKFIPFRDEAALARVRAIKRADLTRHTNPNFRIEIIEDKVQFYSRFALDIVQRIQQAAQAAKKCVLILRPARLAIAAEMLNRLNISCRHLITFN